MKQVRIYDWNNYGDYMLFANVVSDNKLSVILQVDNKALIAMGYPGMVDRFIEELQKKLSSNKIQLVYEVL